jgi:hypothetical protein
MMPYRQAMAVMHLLLPTSGRDNHVTLRNHTLSVGAAIQEAEPPGPHWPVESEAELGIDVGYVRKVKRVSKGDEVIKDSSQLPSLWLRSDPLVSHRASGRPPCHEASDCTSRWPNS